MQRNVIISKYFLNQAGWAHFDVKDVQTSVSFLSIPSNQPPSTYNSVLLKMSNIMHKTNTIYSQNNCFIRKLADSLPEKGSCLLRSSITVWMPGRGTDECDGLEASPHCINSSAQRRLIKSKTCFPRTISCSRHTMRSA